jgi:hypothetical protein
MIDIRVARQWFQEHVGRQADHSFGLWALWMLERWSRAQRPGVPAATTESPSNSPMTASALG